MNSKKKSIILAGVSVFIGLMFVIYFLMPFFILQIMRLDFISPELDFFFKYAPNNVMFNVTQKSLSKKQPYRVKCRTLHAISKYYSEEKLQSLESLITDCLRSQNEKEKQAAAALYSKRRFAPNEDTIEVLWKIFLDKNENRYTRNLTGLALLKEYYKDSQKSKIIVETYSKLDPKTDFGLLFEYCDGKNANNSFIKLNGLIYQGD